MLSSISWQQYFTFTFTLTIFYYFVLVIKFYKGEVKNLFLQNRNSVLAASQSSSGNTTDNANNPQPSLFKEASPSVYIQQPYAVLPNGDANSQEDLNERLFQQSRLLAESIKVFTKAAGNKKSPKEEVMFGLGQILQNNRDLINTAFQSGINHVIEMHCEQDCSLHLSAEEVRVLWIG